MRIVLELDEHDVIILKRLLAAEAANPNTTADVQIACKSMHRQITTRPVADAVAGFRTLPAAPSDKGSSGSQGA